MMWHCVLPDDGVDSETKESSPRDLPDEPFISHQGKCGWDGAGGRPVAAAGAVEAGCPVHPRVQGGAVFSRAPGPHRDAMSLSTNGRLRNCQLQHGSHCRAGQNLAFALQRLGSVFHRTRDFSVVLDRGDVARTYHGNSSIMSQCSVVASCRPTSPQTHISTRVQAHQPNASPGDSGCARGAICAPHKSSGRLCNLSMMLMDLDASGHFALPQLSCRPNNTSSSSCMACASCSQQFRLQVAARLYWSRTDSKPLPHTRSHSLHRFRTQQKP